MDLALTKNGDLLLEENEIEDNSVSFNFFIDKKSNAIALNFEILSFIEKEYENYHDSLTLNFNFGKQDLCYNVPIILGEQELEQTFYNAIRTQLSSVKSAKTFGSSLFKYINHKLTKESLKEIERLAYDAISYIAPHAIVNADLKVNRRGESIIRFNIQVNTYEINFDFFN